jgi:hypothetical protein
MVAGTIIGASIFVQPSEIACHLETPAQIMVVWAACGLLTLAPVYYYVRYANR